MERIFYTRAHGAIHIKESLYAESEALAVYLEDGNGELLTKLSVHLPKSSKLPSNCFYMKWWSENYFIAMDAVQSGWFKVRTDIPNAASGHIKEIPVIELLEKQMTLKEVAKMVKEWKTE